ncbi:MAG: Ribosylpyrimidine nucleosidase [Solirubrobacterales bacterium]|nr:Ribosylpyrimidine nucleosidase [Solirubrobacterales bacterium]
MTVPCVLDCDPGHDDAVAILLAAALPELDLRAITTVAGNGTLERTSENALRVATLARLDVPIAAGAAAPLSRELVTSPDIHGRTALDGPALPAPDRPLDPRPAVDLLADVLLAADEPVAVIATGPLTNVALLLRRGPEVRGRIREIVLMGGSTGPGNVTPAAEFNIYVDPEAADEVFAGGIPLRMAGLNLTHQALATDAVRARMRALGTELGRIADEWLDFFAGTYRSRFGLDGPPVHDPCAVAWLAHPDIVSSTRAFVAIERDGRFTRGATVVDLHDRLGREPNADVGLELDVERFWDLVIGALGPQEKGV